MQLFPTKQTRQSASVPFLITQNCFDITWRNVKSVLSVNELAGKVLNYTLSEEC